MTRFSDRWAARERHVQYGGSRSTHSVDGFDPHIGINEFYGSQAVVEQEERNLDGVSHDNLGSVTSDQHHAELHAASHASGGSDEVTLGAVGAYPFHAEPLTDGASNFIFSSGDIVVVVGVPN